MWPETLVKNPAKPPVSIITPTYNRRKFLPWLIECIKAQDYPKERMEWLIYDDGSDPVLDLLTPYMTAMNIRYFRSDTKLNIGAKRNHLHKEARGDILVVMDDDDYYPPNRVSHAVYTIMSKKVDIVGSTMNHLFFTDDKSIWQVGPYNSKHATFGTMAFTKNYARTHSCDESRVNAEEIEFTNKYTENLAQLDPQKVMLVMCHTENTFSKNKLREDSNPLIKKTSYKLRDFIKPAGMREFYSNA
jgi:glycosyltransferase involved in cell wall biosynthesis